MMKRSIKIVIAMVILFSGLFWRGEQANALINILITKNLVVINTTDLLDDYTKPDSVVGSIAGVQNVELACGVNEIGKPSTQLCVGYSQNKDYILVKTWMGDKWIEDDSRIIYGNYQEMDQDITILNEEKLYDQPVGIDIFNKDNQPKENDQTLQPQKLHVTGAIHYSPQNLGSEK